MVVYVKIFQRRSDSHYVRVHVTGAGPGCQGSIVTTALDCVTRVDVSDNAMRGMTGTRTPSELTLRLSLCSVYDNVSDAGSSKPADDLSPQQQ